MASLRQKITPFLWFSTEAEEAAHFYTSIFPDSRITGVTRYDAGSAEATGQEAGAVLTIGFELAGQPFTALNGGPKFTFTEAVSFVVHCENQEEVDQYWNALCAGGREDACGWLKDKYGLSWQIVPDVLLKYLQDTDKVKAQHVMQAMLQMKKIDISVLEEAYQKS